MEFYIAIAVIFLLFWLAGIGGAQRKRNDAIVKERLRKQQIEFEAKAKVDAQRSLRNRHPEKIRVRPKSNSEVI